MRARLAVLIAVASLLLILVFWRLLSAPPPRGRPAVSIASFGTSSSAATAVATPGPAPTAVHAHNLMLRRGPDFRIYVRWLKGEMVRTHRDVNPTFDDPESF